MGAIGIGISSEVPTKPHTVTVDGRIVARFARQSDAIAEQAIRTMRRQSRTVRPVRASDAERAHQARLDAAAQEARRLGHRLGFWRNVGATHQASCGVCRADVSVHRDPGGSSSGLALEHRCGEPMEVPTGNGWHYCTGCGAEIPPTVVHDCCA